MCQLSKNTSYKINNFFRVDNMGFENIQVEVVSTLMKETVNKLKTTNGFLFSLI